MIESWLACTSDCGMHFLQTLVYFCSKGVGPGLQRGPKNITKSGRKTPTKWKGLHSGSEPNKVRNFAPQNFQDGMLGLVLNLLLVRKNPKIRTIVFAMAVPHRFLPVHVGYLLARHMHIGQRHGLSTSHSFKPPTFYSEIGEKIWTICQLSDCTGNSKEILM